MKRLLALLLVAVGCTPKPTPVTAPVDSGTSTVDAVSSSSIAQPVHFIGRFDRRDPSVAVFSYAGSAIVARFDGEGIDADMETNGHDVFAVVVDNGQPKYVTPPSGRGKRTLASGLSKGTHDIGVYKATEAALGVAKFYGFQPASTIVASPFPFAHRIEIIGDSISNGYGVLGPDGKCPFSADTESEWAAWGAIAARNLKAAHTTIAYSGKGVVRNSNGSTIGTMQSIFERTLADSENPKWDFSAWTPEVVVINLGTNDWAQGDPGPTFIDGYFGLLQTVRSRYPNASIVCALGTMMTQVEIGKTRAYVNEAMKRINDPRITYLELGHPTSDDGLGCERHPSGKTQEKMGMALAAHIKEKMKW